MSGLLKYADSLRVKVDSISLGQGQGPKARIGSLIDLRCSWDRVLARCVVEMSISSCASVRSIGAGHALVPQLIVRSGP